MTEVEKASIILTNRNVNHDIIESRLFLAVWNEQLEEVYDFQIAAEEVTALATEYDETI